MLWIDSIYSVYINLGDKHCAWQEQQQQLHVPNRHATRAFQHLLLELELCRPPRAVQWKTAEKEAHLKQAPQDAVYTAEWARRPFSNSCVRVEF